MHRVEKEFNKVNRSFMTTAPSFQTQTFHFESLFCKSPRNIDQQSSIWEIGAIMKFTVRIEHLRHIRQKTCKRLGTFQTFLNPKSTLYHYHLIISLTISWIHYHKSFIHAQDSDHQMLSKNWCHNKKICLCPVATTRLRRGKDFSSQTVSTRFSKPRPSVWKV